MTSSVMNKAAIIDHWLRTNAETNDTLGKMLEQRELTDNNAH
jgi:hypothetical protein